MTLNEDYLKKVKGGGYGIYAAIAAAIGFIISVVDGIIRPVRCNL